METVQHSGLGGSRVLVSDGADQFDPDSLLNEPETKPSEVAIPIAILTVSPPMNLELFKIVGFFEGLRSEQTGLTLEMTVLLPVALELSHLVLMKDSTNLVSLEIRNVNPEPSIFELPEFQLISVQIDSPLNNRVKTKVLFKPYEHH